jgi:hypothetical protein
MRDKNMRKKLIWLVPAAIAGMALFAFLGGEVVLLLWNWLLPPLFGWHVITFWQALGLLALCRILFGGFGFHNGRSGGKRRMKDRCERMTPEERERFREAMNKKWGAGPEAGESRG